MNKLTTTMGGANSRQSNFEALRLLCMLMVLNLHSFNGYSHGDGLWQAFDFFRESTSICAVNCFILISGYFGIKWKFKSIFNLIFQLFFYSVGIYMVVVALGVVDWNLKDFLLRFTCLFRDSWWFAISYLLLFFCAPLLNAFADNASKRELFLYIVIYFCVLNFISIPREEVFTFALLYLIGRLLSKVEIDKITFHVRGAYWFTTLLIFSLVYFVIYKAMHINNADVVCEWPVGFIGYDYAAPLVILQAVFLFLVFSKMRFKSKFVNWCASSCFAIYLIHMHPTIKEIGYYSLTESLYNCPPLQHYLLLFIVIITIFFASILVDKIRIIVSNGIYSLTYKIRGVLPNRLFKLESYLPKRIISTIND